MAARTTIGVGVASPFMVTTPDLADLLGTAGTWELDPDNSSVRFVSTSMWGLVKVKGEFTGLSGTGRTEAGGSLSGELVIDATSVSTGNNRRDTHLRSDDFLKTSTHPQITYAASGAESTGSDTARIAGTLTVAGTSQPLDLDAKVDQVDDTAVTLSAHVDLDRSTWGVSWRKLGMTNMLTPLDITARFTRSDPT